MNETPKVINSEPETKIIKLEDLFGPTTWISGETVSTTQSQEKTDSESKKSFQTN